MAVFAVISVPPQDLDGLASAIKNQPGNEFMRLNSNTWLVSSTGTARELSLKLGVNSEHPSTGSAVVVGISAYWGRANPDIWDWLKIQLEKGPSGE
jgi:hypothetical protein